MINYTTWRCIYPLNKGRGDSHVQLYYNYTSIIVELGGLVCANFGGMRLQMAWSGQFIHPILITAQL